MKCLIPEIAWHNRDPVLSVDFQPSRPGKDFVRLATGGCDSHVVIWYVKTDDNGSVLIEVAADLFHHQKAVNVVRWSPNGELLASGDDESAIIIWKQKTDVDPPQLFEVSNEQDRETWNVYKLLRGHVEDVYDLSWCPMSKFLISGSVDNTAIVWDIHKGKSMGILHHKGFVQGVCWDPSNQYAISMSSDRIFRVFDVNSKKVIARSSKAILPLPVLHPYRGQTIRLFHDDTLQSFFRRLHFSPDGQLIAVPTGFIEGDQTRGLKNMNATYIYSRYSLQTPICVLPCGDSPALAVRWSPVRYTPRKDGPAPLIVLPSASRMVLAVGSNDSITIYDTQQSTPIAIVLNPQYARLTDLTWSNDGHILIVSSSDGYCSIISFSMNELGEIFCEETNSVTPMDVDGDKNKNASNNSTEKQQTDKDSEESHKTPNKGEKKRNTDSEVRSEKLTPKCKSPKPKLSSGKKKTKPVSDSTPIKTIVIDEAAMEPWSQDGFMTKVKNASPKQKCDIVIDNDPTQDMKLVYEETEDMVVKHVVERDALKSERKDNISDVVNSESKKEINEKIQNERKDSGKENIMSVVDNTKCTLQGTAPRTPRRVTFITLSSPKNKKNLSGQ